MTNEHEHAMKVWREACGAYEDGTAPKWCALLGARAIIAALPKETDNAHA